MRILSLIISLFFISCTLDDAAPLVLSKINIVSSIGTRLDAFSSEPTQLSLNGTDQVGNPFAITSAIIWSSDNNNVKVDETGLVTPLVVGKSIVTAKVEDLEKSITITVWDSSAPRTDIFVSDAGNFQNGPWQILIYDEEGANPYVFTKKNLGWPQDILVLEDQELVLVSNLNTGNITKYNVNSGNYIGNFATGISGPTRMKIGKDNLLYVLQWQGDGLVRRYHLDGTFKDNFTKKGVNQSIGIDWDSDGNLYVSSFADKTVRKFDQMGNDLGLFISSQLNGPTDIWFDDTDLLVNDWSGGAIKKFNMAGSFVSTIASGLSQVEGIASFENGNFIVGDGGNSKIKMYSKSGSFIKDFVAQGAGGLKQPNALYIRKVNQ